MNTGTEREPRRPTAATPSSDRRDARVGTATDRQRPDRRPLSRIADVAWFRAGRRGFVPGRECEYYLESELERLRRPDGTRDA